MPLKAENKEMQFGCKHMGVVYTKDISNKMTYHEASPTYMSCLGSIQQDPLPTDSAETTQSRQPRHRLSPRPDRGDQA